MATNYILIDYENVQPKDLGLLEGTSYQVRVFLGSQQGKIPEEFASQMQPLGKQASYIRVKGSGRNALDLHIAYYIGKLAAEDPGRRFHVISRDAGFKVLLEHLGEQGIPCTQIKSLAELPKADQAKAMTLDEKLDFIIDHLARMNDKKPSSLKTLHNRIRNNCLGGEATESELIEITDALQKRGFLQVDKTKIRYASDGSPGHTQPSYLP